MKKTKLPAFIVMFIVLLFLIVLFLTAAASNNNNNNSTGSNPANNNSTNNNPGNNTGNNPHSMCGVNGCPMMAITLNSQEVAKHNNANDCWMIINGGFYDLTNFLNLHSGGSQLILQYCGTDGSVGFNTKDSTGSHSSRDLAILNQYYLGDLGQKITK